MSTFRRASANTSIASERLDEGLGFVVRTTFRALVRSLGHELQPHGISTSDWAVLRVLWREHGMSQVELADRMGVERSSLTRVLAGLEARGLLFRTRDEDDGRKLRLELTPSGQALESVLVQCGLAANERALRGLDRAEVEATRRVLERMVQNLEN